MAIGLFLDIVSRSPNQTSEMRIPVGRDPISKEWFRAPWKTAPFGTSAHYISHRADEAPSGARASVAQGMLGGQQLPACIVLTASRARIRCGVWRLAAQSGGKDCAGLGTPVNLVGMAAVVAEEGTRMQRKTM